jgi:hypothetical protein
MVIRLLLQKTARSEIVKYIFNMAMNKKGVIERMDTSKKQVDSQTIVNDSEMRDAIWTSGYLLEVTAECLNLLEKQPVCLSD